MEPKSSRAWPSVPAGMARIYAQEAERHSGDPSQGRENE
jgi:hypothetical protein